MKIGLLAYRKNSLIPYQILYTWKQVLKHNQSSNVLPIKREQWMLAALLARNELFLSDMKDFERKYSKAKTTQEQIHVAANPRLYIPRYTEIKHTQILNNFKRRIVYQGKELGGDHLLVLFYARVLDTQPNVSHCLWRDIPFSLTLPISYEGSLSINILHANISKSALIKYINEHWEDIKAHLPELYERERYNVSERDLLMVDLKKKGRTNDEIMYAIADKFPDQDPDTQSVKVARLRAEQRIANIYRAV